MKPKTMKEEPQLEIEVIAEPELEPEPPVVEEMPKPTIKEMEAERAEWLKKRAEGGEMNNMEIYEECCANLRRLNYAIIDLGGVPGR
jgi:hypothetical protein